MEAAGLRTRARAAVHLYLVAPLLLGLGFFAAWTWLCVVQYGTFHDHDTFHSLHRDLSINSQVLWNTARGHLGESTLLTRNANVLAEHLAPFLYLLTPFYWLWPDPRWLIALQQAALALAGVPVYLLARRRLGGTWPPALLLASFYLAPVVGETAFDYWHPNAFTTVPLAFGAYFLLSGRPRRGAIVALSALLFEVEAALPLVGLGAMLLLQRRVRLGLLLAAIGTAWLALVTLVIMPSFHLERTLPEEGNRTLHKFQGIRENPLQAWTLLLERGPDAARWLLLPNAGLSLLSPQTLLASVPTAAVLVFADDPKYLRSHRDAPILPLLWISAVEGAALLRGGWRLRLGLVLLLVLSATAYLADSRLPGGSRYEPDLTQRDALSESMQRAVAAVPAQASVGASATAAAHLATREYVKIFPFGYARALKPEPRQIEWWLLDVTDEATRQELLGSRDSPLKARPPYALWLLDRSVLVATDQPPRPLHAAQALFGRALRLDGYDLQRSASGLRAQLGWKVVRPLDQDLVRHLELVDGAGTPLAGDEGPASGEFYGTSRWAAGQVVVEEVSLAVRPAAAAGPLHLRLRWLEPGSDEALTLPGGSSELDLETSAP